MMSSLDLRGRTLDVRFLRRALPRAEFDVTAALEQVRPICEDVEHRGAAALRDLGERFDGVRPTHLRVPRALLQSALDQLDPTCAPRSRSRSVVPASCTPTSAAPTRRRRWCPAAP